MKKDDYIKQLLEDRLLTVKWEIQYFNSLIKSYSYDDEEYDYSEEILHTKDAIIEYEDEKKIIEEILKDY